MAEPRNVVIIGSGPAGYVCAIRLAQLGHKATVIEKESLGGTCLNVGCIPSKAMIVAGSLLEKIHKAAEIGIAVENVRLDLGKLVSWKDTVVKKHTGGVGMLFKSHKIDHVVGTGRIAGKGKVEVDGPEGKRTLACDDIVIATGSAPMAIPGFAFDGDKVWSSTDALAPKRLPDHLLVIGGGYIGLELGMMYRKLGSKVTVIEFTEGALPGQDRDCVKVIERSIKKLGIDLVTEAAAKSWSKKGSGLEVLVEMRKGGTKTYGCDQILCTVGRKPYTDGLGLETIGLQPDPKGFLTVDKQMRTSVPNVYAIGDVAGQPMLAHKGSKEGLVCAAVIAGKKEEYDARCVPAVIFTSPEMASAGWTEAEAEKHGRKVKTGQFPFGASARATSLRETEGFVKMVVDEATDELLGVHMVGPDVTELIAEACLAIEMGATAEDIARTIHAHPTLPEAVMEAAEAVEKMAIHIYQKR